MFHQTRVTVGKAVCNVNGVSNILKTGITQTAKNPAVYLFLPYIDYLKQ